MLSAETLTWVNQKLTALQNDRTDPDQAVRFRDFITKTPAESLRPVNTDQFRSVMGLSRYAAVTLLLKSVRQGLMEISWSTCCPACSGVTHQTSDLKEVQETSFCPGCNAGFDLSVDENLKVAFSAAEPLLDGLASEGEIHIHSQAEGITGADLLTNAYFRQFFSDQVVPEDRGLKIKNITLLFTDLKGSTELYEKIGDLNAYRIVREHFDSVTAVIESHNGALVKTIGDSVMASFSSSEDGLKAAIDIQKLFREETAKHRLVLKMGLHAGPALVVNLNGTTDYFGSTVNIAARVQNLSKGGDVFISKVIFDDPRSLKYLRQMPVIFRYKTRLKGIREDYLVYQLNDRK
ncbi:MAG: adenylate/guanylate cyclase domain-containing protein [Bacteroidetes bacterium]|nr:adenylate/guanylate cyclase domain-containing protein [Bacteroidota bacterium]